MTPLARRASAALALRAHVLTCFGSAAPARASIDALTGAADDAWGLLLTAESVALPLVEVLRRHGVFDALGTRVTALLISAQVQETQRVMAAKLVLRELDRIARESGLRVTVLKGGVRLADSPAEPPIDLGDVDVLVSPAQASPLWKGLVARGWSPRPGITATDDRRLESNHYAPLYAPGNGFVLEIHESLEYGAGENFAPRITHHPLAGFTAIDRPTGAAYVMALLTHAVVKHPFRRGHLRDVVLIAGEMQQLSLGELRAVRREIADDVFAPELMTMFDQCLALRDGKALFDTPESLSHVALKYLTALGYGLVLGLVPERITVSHVPLERPAVRREFYLAELRGLTGLGAAGTYFDRLRERIGVPGIGYAAAWFARAGYRATLMTGAAALGWRVRRDVQATLDGIASCGPSSVDAT